jgi:hypothetical protein
MKGGNSGNNGFDLDKGNILKPTFDILMEKGRKAFEAWRFIMWHILYRRLLLLLLIIGNRFLLFINIYHRRINYRHCSHRYRRFYNGFYNHIALHYGCNGSRYRGSATIGVGTQSRFSSSHISRGTVLLLITSSSRKIACLVSTILMYLPGQ